MENPLNSFAQQKIVEEKYHDAIDFFNGRYAFFVTHVLKIGEPKWTKAVPTAAVALPEKGTDINDFKFLFNPDFAQQFDTEGFAFVVAHECMHMILNHLHQADKYENHAKFNIAADCVINDYLTAAGLTGDEKFCYGENYVGFNCANATVAEVYDLIPDEKVGGGGADGKDGRGEGALDDHSWMHDGTQDQSEALDKMYDKIQDDMPAEMDKKRDDIDRDQKQVVGDLAGTGTGAIEEFKEMFGVGLNWVALMKKLNPDVFKRKAQGPPERPSFHQPRRKLVAHYPEIMLPVKRIERRRVDQSPEQPSIVMALDTSGSIGPQDSNRFITLAQSIPQERIHLFTCTFQDAYEVLDLNNPHFRSGGTSFSAIEEYIQKEVVPQLGHYPKSVVVITDGYASFNRGGPDEQYKKNWLWLLTEGGTDSYYGPLFGEVLKLTDYIK